MGGYEGKGGNTTSGEMRVREVTLTQHQGI